MVGNGVRAHLVTQTVSAEDRKWGLAPSEYGSSVRFRAADGAYPLFRVVTAGTPWNNGAGTEPALLWHNSHAICGWEPVPIFHSSLTV